jgi:hypothetical protein
MQTVYIGNTLVNDIFLGSQRMDDVFENPSSVFTTEYLVVAGGGRGANGTATRRGGGAGAGGLLSGSVSLLTNTINQIDTNMNQYNYDLGTIAKQIFDAHSRTFLSYFDFNEMNRIINQQQQVIIDSNNNNNNNALLPIINGSSNNSPSSSTNSSSSSSSHSNEIQRILNLVI